VRASKLAISVQDKYKAIYTLERTLAPTSVLKRMKTGQMQEQNRKSTKAHA
jgi:hypothetical protein